MGLIITPKNEIEKYFQSDRLSQSTLKQLLGGFDSFLSNQQKETDDKENKSFIIGSAVDCVLTGKEGQFSEEYYVSQIEKKPSDVEMQIIQNVFDGVVATDVDMEYVAGLEEYPQFVEVAIDTFNWQSRWKIETRIKKIIEVGTEYFEDLKRAYGKQILSEQESMLIQNIVESLRSHTRTAEYFDRGRFTNTVEVEVYYQLPIYFVYRDIDCKALLDMMIVFRNPETKQIESVQPIDLKTMYGYTNQFVNNLKRFRYDIQAAWYTLAIQYWLAYRNDTIKIVPGDLNSSDVNIKPFKFVVESTSDIGKPLVYVLSDSLLEIGKRGRPQIRVENLSIGVADELGDTILQREVKGFEQLVDEYLFYSATEWKEDKVVTQNMKNGVLELNWNGIVTN